MCMKTRSIWRSPNISSHLKMFMQASLQSILRWKPTHEQAGENYFVISLYKSEKICIIICSLPFLKRQTSWRRSEAAVTRRTRNAFIGSSRYEGSNPSVSAGKPLRNQGLLLFVLHIFPVYLVWPWQMHLSASSVKWGMWNIILAQAFHTWKESLETVKSQKRKIKSVDRIFSLCYTVSIEKIVTV